MDLEQINVEVNTLIDAWCDRRALRPLGHVLPAWPHNGLTDGIAELRNALENARPIARDDLLEDEIARLGEIIVSLNNLVERP